MKIHTWVSSIVQLCSDTLYNKLHMHVYYMFVICHIILCCSYVFSQVDIFIFPFKIFISHLHSTLYTTCLFGMQTLKLSELYL